MYWYYKYPFYLILAVIVLGAGYLIYSRIPWAARTGTAAASGDAPPESRPHQASAAALEAAPANNAGRLLMAADRQLAADNPLAARSVAAQVFLQPDVHLLDEQWTRAAEIVSRANTIFLNSDAPCPEKARYEVRAGDSLVKIAAKFNTTVGALQRANKSKLQSDSALIFPGMVLHVYQGTWSIVVVKTRFALLLMDGERLFKYYPVAIGRQDRTPVGTFVIGRDKLREPAWTPPGRNIPYGDPANVLGTRWLGLTPTGQTPATLKGYGIHGTWEPDSIGTAASEGCVRMNNSDVEELFDIVPAGAEVRIKEE